jgi:hypothetical protein
MKKTLSFILCFIFVSSSIVTAIALSPRSGIDNNKYIRLDQTGIYDGFLGFQVKGNWTEIGTINGSYYLRNRFGRFNGKWSIKLKNDTITGTMKGRFGKRFLIGLIAIDGFDRSMSIIGFININVMEMTIHGRFMPLIGPPLSYRGVYN